MLARLLFLFAILIGLAVAPVRAVAKCALAAPVACDHCCSSTSHDCCAASDVPAHPAPLAPTGASSDDGQQLASPTFVFVSLIPLPAVEPPAVQRLHAARLPAIPRLDLNCALLI